MGEGTCGRRGAAGYGGQVLEEIQYVRVPKRKESP